MDNKQQIFHIYKITNNVNGKIYIGQTSKTIKWRFSGHLSNAKAGGKNYFYTAIRKYGKENFSIESLCVCHSKKNADKLEIMFIKKFDSMNPDIGYNMAPGGDGGFQCSEVMKRAQSFRTPESYKHKPETKVKISTTMKIIGQTEEFKKTRAKSGLKLKGRKQSPEQVAKMKERLSKISQTEEFKARMRHARSQVKNPKGPPKGNIPHNRIGDRKSVV